MSVRVARNELYRERFFAFVGVITNKLIASTLAGDTHVRALSDSSLSFLSKGTEG